MDGTGIKTFEPPFTFHGFRYAEITGLSSMEQLKAIEGVMIADDVDEVGFFNSSDENLNKLWDVIKTTYFACLKSVLLDVADRDERWGWLGDCFALHLDTLPYFFDISSFYQKRAQDILDDQSEDGLFPVQSPRMQQQWATCWSDTGVLLPYAAYRIYGNRQLVEKCYPAVRKYVEAIFNNTNKKENFCDWLSESYTATPNATSFDEKRNSKSLSSDFFDLCYNYRAICAIIEMAEILDFNDDKKKYETIKEELLNRFCKEFVANDGSCHNDSQSAYALALSFDMIPEELREKAEKKMVDAVYRFYSGKLSTGTPTTIELLKALSNAGHCDIAYDLVMQKEYPSFGYMLDCGATAIWERFDTFRHDIGYNTDPMNGIIHAGFCSVGEWIARYIGGISIYDGNITISPAFPKQLSYSNFTWKTKYGNISCNWKREGDKYQLTGETPHSATLHTKWHDMVLSQGEFHFEWIE